MRLRRRSARGKLKAGVTEEIQYPLPYDAAIVCVLTSSLTCLSSYQKVGLSFSLGCTRLLPVGISCNRYVHGLFLCVSILYIH